MCIYVFGQKLNTTKTNVVWSIETKWKTIVKVLLNCDFHRYLGRRVHNNVDETKLYILDNCPRMWTKCTVEYMTTGQTKKKRTKIPNNVVFESSVQFRNAVLPNRPR